jgi:hypothetical protein
MRNSVYESMTKKELLEVIDVKNSVIDQLSEKLNRIENIITE